MQANILQEYFSIQWTESEHALLSLPASELVTKEGMIHFVNTYQPLIKGLYPPVAATYFCCTLATAAAGVLYCLSVENRVPDFSLDQFTVQIEPAQGYYRVLYVLHNAMFQYAPQEEEDRNAWRAQVLESYYRQTVVSIVQTISAVTGATLGQIWGQFPGVVDYYVNASLANTALAPHHQRMKEDYHFLAHGLDPQVFGRKKNPFQVRVRFVPDMMDPTKVIRLRSSCCLYFQTQGGEYCYNCPRISEEEREKRRSQIAHV